MINGVINVYKEKGFTSHDAVAKLRGILGQKKIGHTGTLDPDAEGVLVVCLGKATRACDYLNLREKTYEAVMLLGTATDTQDISGKVLEEKDASRVTEKMIGECAARYVGTYEQLPPMYSAIKVNGKRLYELARQGKSVQRDTRAVTIYGINIKEIRLPRVRMEIKCSKGTYIRTLCSDIGDCLSTGACMESLIRTASGGFAVEDSIKLSDIERYKNDGSLMEHVLALDRIFSEFPAVYVTGRQEKQACNGNPISADGLNISRGGSMRVYDSARRFIGLYRFDEDTSLFKAEKMFFDEKEPHGEN